MFRVMLRLRKGEEIKYLSHRDFIRTFELALRRAKIPIAFSEGFNPRPKMSFGNAIGVGVTSEDERIQLDLSEPRNPSDVKDSLNSNLPPGMEVIEAEILPEGRKSPLSTLNASEFCMTASCEECSLQDIKAALAQLLAAAEIKVTREKEGRRKEIDIRQYLLGASAEQNEDGTAAIDVALGSGNSGGAGVRDFVQAIEKVLPTVEVRSACRKRQFQNG